MKMAVKMRLKRMGKKKQPTYRVVVADSRAPRDGRIIELLGRYDPRQEPSLVEIDNERAQYWLSTGAQPTDRVRKLLEISGAVARAKVSRSGVYRLEDDEPPAPAEPAQPVDETPAESPQATDQAGQAGQTDQDRSEPSEQENGEPDPSATAVAEVAETKTPESPSGPTDEPPAQTAEEPSAGTETVEAEAEAPSVEAEPETGEQKETKTQKEAQ